MDFCETQAHDCILPIWNTHACATESDFCNALENYGISYTDSVVADCEFISLYNEVSLYSVVHFGIPLPRCACIQAESNKNRIHTLGHAF